MRELGQELAFGPACTSSAHPLKADISVAGTKVGWGSKADIARAAPHVPDAGSCAPVTVLIDERPDGVHVSCDKMESYLLRYGSSEALAVAPRALDAKITTLLRECATWSVRPSSATS